MAFELVASFKSEHGHVIEKYRSSQTKLSVCFVQAEGPIVNGFFALSTETSDDDGCPHTLEHLVFLGSEKYPFKGVLDRLANRSLAQGTNAWTDTDNVVFTISTAGSEGFLSILPVYLDHILYCTMTDSGFTTEVHHINEEGENAGVVYCEMQGRQNTGPDLIHNRLLQIMYPGKCGYNCETGGLMENLRSLTVEKIRQFHHDYFRPENLCLMIIGIIDPKTVFEALKPIEEKIIEKGPRPEMPRPWVSSPIPEFTQSVEEVVEFPDEDGTIGEVILAWRGPKYDDFIERNAFDVFWQYLTDSSVSLLNQHFVEIDEPICTGFEASFINNLSVLMTIKFKNTTTEQLFEVRPKFFDVLINHLAEGIDMERMKLVLQNMESHAIDSVESHPQYHYAFPILGDFLYGDLEGKELSESLKKIEHYKIFAGYTSNDWVKLVEKYLINLPYGCVIGKPSPAVSTTLAEHETKRLEEQKSQLGEEGMIKMKEHLEEAKRLNEQPIPKEMIESFPIPGVSSISFFPVISSGSNEANKVKEYLSQQQHKTVTSIPIFQFDHIGSAFIEIQIFINTCDLPQNLRSYLEIYLEAFFNLPVTKDGITIPYEEIVKQLDELTVQHSNTIGLSGSNFVCGDFAQLVTFKVRCKKGNYYETVKFLSGLLWDSVFAVDRLKVACTKLLNDIPQQKREGMKVTRAAMKLIGFNRNSNHTACSMFHQSEFLQEVLDKLEINSESVINDLNSLREQICFPENFLVRVAGNILQLENPNLPWIEYFETKKRGTKKDIILKSSYEFLSPVGENPSNKGLVIDLPSVESSFSIHLTKGPRDFHNPDYCSLLVLSEYLTTMEGIFWQQIRGQGLAYSCDIATNPETGNLTFIVYRAPDAFKAYEKAKQIVEDLVSKKLEFNLTDIEGAKSGVIFSLISDEENIYDAASQYFVTQHLQKIGENSKKKVLENVMKVTIDDIRYVLDKYVKNLFDPNTSNTIAVTPSTKYQEMCEAFKTNGYNLLHVDSIDKIVSLT